MLIIDLWKRIVIWGLCALGLALALPNAFYSRVESVNDAQMAIEMGADTPENQAAAAQWPSFLPSGLVNLGLDLRGGAHLLAEVKVSDVYDQRMKALWPDVRDILRPERATIGTIRLQNSPAGELHVKIANADQILTAVDLVSQLSRPIASVTGVGQQDLSVSSQGDTIIITLSEAEKAATDDRTVRQSLEIIRRRIDEVGTREPTIQRQGADRILIQVPGIGSAGELKELIGTTAQLTFQPVISRGSDANAIAGAGNEILPSLDQEGVY